MNLKTFTENFSLFTNIINTYSIYDLSFLYITNI